MAVLMYDPIQVISDYDKELESKIIDLLSSTDPMKIKNLISKLESEKFDNFAIREILWRLINSGQIELTEDRKIKLRN
jgi:hypothetical protein